MPDTGKTRCDMKQTLRHAPADVRDQYVCGFPAEFIVVLRGGTADQSKFTCAQHLSKAVRVVLAITDDARATVALLKDVL